MQLEEVRIYAEHTFIYITEKESDMGRRHRTQNSQVVLAAQEASTDEIYFMWWGTHHPHIWVMKFAIGSQQDQV